jgi:hypothetical protein
MMLRSVSKIGVRELDTEHSTIRLINRRNDTTIKLDAAQLARWRRYMETLWRRS